MPCFRKENGPPKVGGPNLTIVRRSENILDNFHYPNGRYRFRYLEVQSSGFMGCRFDLAQLNHDILMNTSVQLSTPNCCR